ncbi:MAG: glycosyltransferase family 2 protein [Desulfovibrionaceae bacterium]|nr:glycosyltransferase family 2 protein [Desulfovibrionaceae bacterium]
MLSVLIPVYNKWSLTEECLTSLAKTGGDGCDVILVDNASSDETAQAAPALGAKLFPGRFTYIREECNRNFAGAINDGAARARGTYLLWLNNDTILLDGWREPLIDALSHDPSLGAVGPLLLYPSKNGKQRVQHAGIVFSLNREVSHLYEFFPANHAYVRKKRRLQAITGAAFCIARERFLSLGGLNERFRNGFEDVEFCDRLCRAGFAQTVIPDSRIIHIGQQTEGRGAYERENSALCGELCTTIRFDKARVFREDGYTPIVSPWLKGSALTFLPVTTQYTLEHKEALAAKSTAPLYALTELDPYWIEGGLALASRLEEALQLKDAFHEYIRLLDFCSTPDVLLPAAQFLKRHDPSLFERFLGPLSLYRTTPAARSAALYAAEKKLRAQGEEELAWQVNRLGRKNADFFAHTYPALARIVA